MITKLDIVSAKYKCLYNSLLYLNKGSRKLNDYKMQGFANLREKVDNLPENIAFVPSFISKRSTCLKIYDKLYIFLSKCNLKKPVDNMFDSLYHEVGHWLHFQQMPPKAERQVIWKTANKQKIKEDISERAIQDDDGKEFVAEVFKKLVKGEKVDGELTYLYYLLNGPIVK
jgi:hypothetical protein